MANGTEPARTFPPSGKLIVFALATQSPNYCLTRKRKAGFIRAERGNRAMLSPVTASARDGNEYGDDSRCLRNDG
jgi:hypothetical protein